MGKHVHYNLPDEDLYQEHRKVFHIGAKILIEWGRGEIGLDLNDKRRYSMICPMVL